MWQKRNISLAAATKIPTQQHAVVLQILNGQDVSANHSTWSAKGFR